MLSPRMSKACRTFVVATGCDSVLQAVAWKQAIHRHLNCLARSARSVLSVRLLGCRTEGGPMVVEVTVVTSKSWIARIEAYLQDLGAGLSQWQNQRDRSSLALGYRPSWSGSRLASGP